MSNSKLIKELNRTFAKDNVLTELEERYAYSFDASNNQLNKPIADAVVFVETVEQVQQTVKIANKYKIPIICRGAGTNTVGACIPACGGIILNFSKMNKILEINYHNMTATVQPGVIVGDLQKAVETKGLFYPPDPSNLKVSTIGGSIAQNSAGARCFKYGATKDYIIDMLVVSANGELIRTGASTIKNAAGYNLGSIFVGSEGTLGIVVEATIKLIPKPKFSQVILAYFEHLEDSIEAVNKIIENKLFPSTIDFMDSNAMKTVEMFYNTGLKYENESALIIEIDGNENDVKTQKNEIYSILEIFNAKDIIYSENEQEYNNIWSARRCSMAACTKLKPNVTTDDIIVPRQNLAKLVKGIQNICNKYKLNVCLVGHVGDGGIHPQIPIDYNNKDEYKRYKLAKSEMYKLLIELDGCISSEHGIGLEKKDLFINYTNKNALNYMRQIKKIFDPNNILNPYKIF